MRTIEIGGHRVRLVGGTDREGGGTGPLVVLLHGFGAPGDDLVALHRVLDVPRDARFAFPHAPLSLAGAYGMSEARAWWHIDMVALEAALASGSIRDLSRDQPVGLDEARAHVIEVIDALRAQLTPSKLILGGFSQGAMLATDVALRTDQKIDALALLSGTLLAEDVWLPKMVSRRGLPALVSHGTHDPILPFALAERLAAELTKAGIDVDFVKFRGQHEIPPIVLERLGALIRRVAA
jgi:phospholipase/carboxylesterase